MQVADGSNLILSLTHAEHLDDALVGAVHAVLGASVALCDPHALMLVADGVADVVGEMHGTVVELADAAARALHAEHLVALADVDDELSLHEVGAKGDLGGVEAMGEQMVFQQAGVEHDVAVVGHIEVLPVGRETVKARTGECVDGTLHDALVNAPHRLGLKLPDGTVATDALAHVVYLFVGIDIGGQQRKRTACGDALHGCRYLFVGIGPDVVKLRPVCYHTHAFFPSF